MLNFTRQQRGEAFDKLPKDIKRVVMSDALAEIYQKIGKEQKLAIDKTGALADLVTLTILDLIPRESLVAKLSEELGTSGTEAAGIAKSVNENVFLKIREILKAEQDKENAATEQEEESEDEEITNGEEVAETTDIPGNREDILAEIENPTPVVHPISALDQTISGAAQPREILPEKHVEATHEFIANTIAGNLSAPAQRVEIDLKKKEPEKPKTYQADPYREPIA